MNQLEPRLLFYDSETGGYSPKNADIIEIGMVLTDATGEEVFEEYEAKVAPVRPVHPGAAAVNGYTPEGWVGAISQAEAAQEVAARLWGSSLVAHQVSFDWRHLSALLAAHELRLPWPGPAMICTEAMAREHGFKKVSLGALADLLGVDRGQPHRALHDARTCRGVYLALKRRRAKSIAAQLGMV